MRLLDQALDVRLLVVGREEVGEACDARRGASVTASSPGTELAPADDRSEVRHGVPVEHIALA